MPNFKGLKGRIKFVQTQLNNKGLDAGSADGILGPRTLVALNAVEEIPAKWAKQRKVVAFIQLLARENNIETGPIDGYWGPQTSFAFESLQHLFDHGAMPNVWRPEDRPTVNPNGWPRQSTEALTAFYGEIGDNVQQSRAMLPYPHKLSWKKSTNITSFSCHVRVKESIEKVLSSVLEHYGMAEIQRLRLDIWGGCLSVRNKRGGSSPSAHSWGIAIDYDPERNQLKWGQDRAAFARPEYDKWWEFWEQEGWVSLGRERNFDWMHVQAAKIG